MALEGGQLGTQFENSNCMKIVLMSMLSNFTGIVLVKVKGLEVVGSSIDLKVLWFCLA